MAQIPRYIEIRFTDGMIYRITVSFIYAHYTKNTKDNPKKTRDEFIANPPDVLKYALEQISWGECQMSAIAVQQDRLPDYNSEYKNPENSKLIYEPAPAPAPAIKTILKESIEITKKAIDLEPSEIVKTELPSVKTAEAGVSNIKNKKILPKTANTKAGKKKKGKKNR